MSFWKTQKCHHQMPPFQHPFIEFLATSIQGVNEMLIRKVFPFLDREWPVLKGAFMFVLHHPWVVKSKAA